MNKNATTEDRITAWLVTRAPTQAPDHLLEETFEQTRAIRRRGSPNAWRVLSMVRTVSIVAAAAVVVIALVAIAGGLFSRSGGVGGPPTAGSASPSPSVSPAVTASVDPSGATATGQLVYQASVDGNVDIYLANGDGSGVTRLTSDPAPDILPAWSPDGTRVSFIRDGDVYVMAADGSGATALTTTPEAEGWPSFTPDGMAVIFGRPFGAEEWAIHQVDVGGSNERSLYAPTVHLEGHARLVADDVLLVVRDTIRGGGLEIARVDLTTGDVTPLTDYREGEASVFAPSPDGSRIAYLSEGAQAGLAVMDADGTDPRHVTASTGGAIAWTADGSTLSFVSGGWINLVRPDGTGRIRLLQGDSPSWRPGA